MYSGQGLGALAGVARGWMSGRNGGPRGQGRRPALRFVRRALGRLSRIRCPRSWIEARAAAARIRASPLTGVEGPE